MWFWQKVSLATKSDNSSELSSLTNNFTKISSVSELSLLPRMEVDTYLSKPERLLELFIDSKVEDLAETDSSCAERMGKNNWYIEKAVYVSVAMC